MTKFKAPVDQGGFDFAISFEKESSFDEGALTESVRDAVVLCRQMVAITKAHIDGDSTPDFIYRYAENFLGLDKKAFISKKSTISADLATLMRNINSSFLIKITPMIRSDGEDRPTVPGMVRAHPIFRRKQHKDFQATRGMSHQLTSDGNGNIDIKSRPVWWSNIHMNARAFNYKILPAVTIIHEFCHKFLDYHDGYNDGWYFGKNGDRPLNYPHGIDKIELNKELIRTADAMAWFIVKSSGKMSDMDKIPSNNTHDDRGNKPKSSCILM